MIHLRVQGNKLISKPIGHSHAQELPARYSRTDKTIVYQGPKKHLKCESKSWNVSFCCRVTQNWNSGCAKNWRPVWLNWCPILAQFRVFPFDFFRRPNRGNRCPISGNNIKIKRRFVQFFRDTFTINIDLVLHVNLERERERGE